MKYIQIQIQKIYSKIQTIQVEREYITILIGAFVLVTYSSRLKVKVQV